MDILLDLLRLLVSILIAFLAGKLISKLKLPSILGWLIAGMIIGPHALNLLDSSVLESQWFTISEHLLECTFGLMIGTELIWKQMKKAGAQILVTTITESLGTFWWSLWSLELFSGLPAFPFTWRFSSAASRWPRRRPLPCR